MIKGIEKKIKNKEQLALLGSFINTYGIDSLAGLRSKINQEIGKCREFLAVNRQYSTINRIRRAQTRKLEYLENIKRIAGRL